ncbi:MAG: hypothetical protein IRY90_02260 [Actinomadura rubrobrunea]|nr:hypothetical protein [Actinomadura rubrobrunea]
MAPNIASQARARRRTASASSASHQNSARSLLSTYSSASSADTEMSNVCSLSGQVRRIRSAESMISACGPPDRIRCRLRTQLAQTVRSAPFGGPSVSTGGSSRSPTGGQMNAIQYAARLRWSVPSRPSARGPMSAARIAATSSTRPYQMRILAR